RGAVAARALDRLRYGERARLEGEPLARIDEARGLRIARDRRDRGAVRAAGPEMPAVLRDARSAVRGDAVELRERERARGRRRHRRGRAGARERRRHQAFEVGRGDHHGAYAAINDWPGRTRVKATGCHAMSKRSSADGVAATPA